MSDDADARRPTAAHPAHRDDEKDPNVPNMGPLFREVLARVPFLTFP